MNQFSMREYRNRKVRHALISVSLWVVAVYVFVYPFVRPPVKVFKDDVTEIVTAVPDFAAITNVAEKKRAFFNYLLPEVKRQNALVMKERLLLMTIQKKLEQGVDISSAHQKTVAELIEKYRIKDPSDFNSTVNELIKRVDIIPPELVLVQAANESAWGTSRFAQQGYNFFGLWCFKKGCGFVPARRTDGSSHEVAKFRNLSHAVMTYIRNLNRHYAYEEMRSIRMAQRDNQQSVKAEAMVQGLMSYSERGQDYIDELLNMISYNRKYMNL